MSDLKYPQIYKHIYDIFTIYYLYHKYIIIYIILQLKIKSNYYHI